LLFLCIFSDCVLTSGVDPSRLVAIVTGKWNKEVIEEEIMKKKHQLELNSTEANQHTLRLKTLQEELTKTKEELKDMAARRRDKQTSSEENEQFEYLTLQEEQIEGDILYVKDMLYNCSEKEKQLHNRIQHLSKLLQELSTPKAP
jgi:chromosome segregation ATPase